MCLRLGFANVLVVAESETSQRLHFGSCWDLAQKRDYEGYYVYIVHVYGTQVPIHLTCGGHQTYLFDGACVASVWVGVLQIGAQCGRGRLATAV